MPFARFASQVFCLAFCLIFSGPAFADTAEQAAAKAGAKRVSGETLKSLYLGHLVSGKTAKGYSYKTPILADGTIEANARRGAGQFSIIDERACMTFEGLTDKKPLWGGKPMCWTIYDLGNGKYQSFRTDGSLSADIEFLPLK